MLDQQQAENLSAPQVPPELFATLEKSQTVLVDTQATLDYFEVYLAAHPQTSIGVDLEGSLQFFGEVELIQISMQSTKVFVLDLYAVQR